MEPLLFRTGFGIDFHQLVAGRAFWIGGIHLEHPTGALGHSDADVLLHAICDALLGSVSLGDIGTHFPDDDPQYKDADSKLLLKQCAALVKNKGYYPGNIDATVCLELPKLKPYIPAMQRQIASLLEIPEDRVSVKATTSEKMGFVGRGEGVAAYATVLVVKAK